MCFIILIVIILGVLLCISKSKNQKTDNNKTEIKDITDEIPEKQDKKLSLVMVGDVLIHESVYKDALKSDNTYDFTKMFTEIKPIIQKYDLKYCNQESTIGGKELGISGYPTFNAPDEIGDAIIDTGFNLIGLANNHAFDKGKQAINYSINYWKNKDVVTSGSYESLEERNRIKIYEKNKVKYAFLSYTTSINGNNLSQDEQYLVDVYDKEKVKKDIENIKDKVDVIMVAMHWGDEYTNIPTNSQREIAQYLSSLGVNLIIGTHPHVVQPIEYVNDTLVIYSLGNFISNQLTISLNAGIGLLVGLDINIKDNKVEFNVNKKELIYAYSNNSKEFNVIPFSKLNDNILKDYKRIEKQYLGIVK